MYRNGASEACRPQCDDPVIVRWMRLCVSLGSVCENGVIVYVDYIFDCPGPFVRIDKPILHLDAYGRRLLTLPDTFAICWLALPVPRARAQAKVRREQREAEAAAAGKADEPATAGEAAEAGEADEVQIVGECSWAEKDAERFERWRLTLRIEAHYAIGRPAIC